MRRMPLKYLLFCGESNAFQVNISYVVNALQVNISYFMLNRMLFN